MKKIFIPLAALAAVCVSMAQVSAPLNKLRYAEQAIANLYVDTVNEDKLVEDAIIGMLEKLDPHSSYTNAKETRELNEPLEGNFSGIGITYNLVKDTVYVISTVANGPSQKVGILPGDRIIAVNDTVIAGIKISQNDVKKYLRGPKGTVANLKTLRVGNGGVADTIVFRVTRDEIPIYSVDAAYMVTPRTGYIKLNKFAAETAKEFTDALKKLKKQGLENLILDLTANGGGYLNSAVELLGEFLPEDYLAVYTEGENSHRQNLYVKPSGKNPLFGEGRLVVMARRVQRLGRRDNRRGGPGLGQGADSGPALFRQGAGAASHTFPRRLHDAPDGGALLHPHRQGHTASIREGGRRGLPKRPARPFQPR